MLATAQQRRRIFVLTWLSYGAYYLCRRPFAVSKSTLATQFHLDTAALAVIDTSYLVAYAAGQFASGLVADRVGARRLLGIGMLSVAGASVAFGFGTTAATFAIAFSLHGFVQATGWPGVVKAMTAMYEPGKRGAVMGWWATCYQAGGLVATALATWLLVHHGWRTAFFVPAAFTAAVGVLVFLLLWQPPLSEPAQRRAASIALARDPLVWCLGASYFCIKLIRYCIVSWLPFFYARQLGYSEGEAGYRSMYFDLGGIGGAIISGYLFDGTGRRRGTLIVALALALAVAFVAYPSVAALGPTAAAAGMVLIGFLLFGPDALVSSVAAQDLGGTAAAGTAAGVINGVGSIGAILQGTLVLWVEHRWGWDGIFPTFAVLSVFAALAVVPYAISVARMPRR